MSPPRRWSASRIIHLAGQSILLTPTEYRLFEVLRSQPGRAFRRAELVAQVMPETIVLERTIDVHIKALRRKLGALAGAIQTVRHVGYRYVPLPEM
jgi:two-component system phosphate regulon response regulator PhoB